MLRQTMLSVAAVSISTLTVCANAQVQYIMDPGRLVGQNYSSHAQRQSVGLYSDNGQLRLAFGSGSTAWSSPAPFLPGPAQLHPPADSFFASTGVLQPDGNYALAGMDLLAFITYNNQTWHSGLQFGGGGIAYLENGLFASAGRLLSNGNLGITLTRSDGTLENQFDLGTDSSRYYAGLQYTGLIDDKHAFYGVNNTQTIDGFLIDDNGQETVQRIFIKNFSNRPLRDLELFTINNTRFLAIAFATSSGGGVWVYNMNGFPLLGTCPADLNDDGELNFLDFAAFVDLFITAYPGADFNGDGRIDFYDFAAFLAAFNAGCP
ncbi:MAG: hypothetical protein LAT64_01900 [Phycisphaerales bacterium]|nr:hypothetical protein [Planctomycetota bacterium]MCH8507513.1 hypothetical protein [Phycisphaerales bacterium]